MKVFTQGAYTVYELIDHRTVYYEVHRDDVYVAECETLPEAKGYINNVTGADVPLEQ